MGDACRQQYHGNGHNLQVAGLFAEIKLDEKKKCFYAQILFHLYNGVASIASTSNGQLYQFWTSSRILSTMLH